MRRVLLVVLFLVPLLVTGTLGAAAAPQERGGGGGTGGDYRHLNPGGPADYEEEVPVNVVFVGYERDDVDRATFLEGLPSEYTPVNRVPTLYDYDPLGIHYTYDYDLTFASSRYEDRFFAELTALAVPESITLYQQAYNDQATNVLDVTANHHIDAPSVERWLAEHPPTGVDTRENTLYFINWYGRDDFLHHVYVKTGEPDPDTGYDFGLLRDSRKLIAWGGTLADDEETPLGRTARVWFYDLSAGPDSFTENWNVDDADVDGDGEPDYRMPPIWEYTEGGHRDPAALSSDLSLVTRYVGVNLLFTPSPLYSAALTPPDLPTSINLDNNTYEGWPGVDASEELVTSELYVDELAELRPLNVFDYDNQDFPLDGDIARCADLLLDEELPCYPDQEGYPPEYGNLFLSNAFNFARTRDDGDAVDYELPNFSYAIGDEATYPPPFLGLADDNYRDGQQSWTYNFVSPGIVESGYGLTTTLIHEDGHHLGMSHPQDGWDAETQTDFSPTGEFLFAWAGTESNSMMSYIDLNWDFSQFDLDNSNRYLADAYTENANTIAAMIAEEGGDDWWTRAQLRTADGLVGVSEVAFARHRYSLAAASAERAYAVVRRAAERLGIEIVGDEGGWEVDADAARADVAARRLPMILDGYEVALRKRMAP